MILLSLIFLFPLFWMIVSALKRPEQLATYPISIFPPKAQWIHFQQALMTDEVVDLWAGLRNSLTVAISTTVIVTITSALAGFGFARYRVRGKDFLFGILLATMMVPNLVVFLPQYVIYARLGLLSLPFPFC